MHVSIFRNDEYDDISDFVNIYKDTEMYVSYCRLYEKKYG